MIEVPQQRIAKLSSAILRVSANLDVDTLLGELAAGARALSGARYAVIIRIDETGQVEDHVMSRLSPEEGRQLS